MPLIAPVMFLLCVGIPHLIWRIQERPKALPMPDDPVAKEAWRLAKEEVDELDWMMGTGDKPEHVVRRETAEASRKREEQRQEAMKRLREAEEEWARRQADKAAGDLEEYQRQVLQIPEKTDSELVKQLYDAVTKTRTDRNSLIPIILRGPSEQIKLLKPPKAHYMLHGDPIAPPDYAVEGVDYVIEEYKAKNGLGDTVMHVREVKPIGEFAGTQEFMVTHPPYPARARKGTRSGGPG